MSKREEQLKEMDHHRSTTSVWSLPSMKEIEGYVNSENGNVNWENICCLDLPEYFIKKWIDCMDWSMISRYSTTLSDKFLIKYRKKIFWSIRCMFLSDNITPNVMRKIPEELDWNKLSSLRSWSVSEIREFRNYINWSIYKHSDFAIVGNVDFFREFSKELNWEEWKNKG